MATEFDRWRKYIEHDFPNLKEGVSFDFTSPVDFNYNCLAWALSFNKRYFDKGKGCFWPWDDIPCDTAEGWTSVCKIHGFAIVEDNDTGFVPGIEKIAILANEDGDLHATRQDRTGKWKSKLGAWGPDIDHNELISLESSYGKVVQVLQRQRPDWKE